MERSAEEEKRGEETYYLYSPCYLVEQLIKALYKCLGKDTQQADADTTPASGAETQMKVTVISLLFFLFFCHFLFLFSLIPNTKNKFWLI